MQSRSVHFLIHTQYFHPEVGAPQARLFELAEGLAKKGFRVSVLSAMPNYPMGKIFPGYMGFYRKETEGLIKIYRCFIFPTQSPSFFLRLSNYFSFVISSFIVGLFIPKVDIIFTESPPLFLGITGFLLSKLKSSKWILNIADLWPLSAVELGIIRENSLGYRISRYLESFLYKKAWIITGQSKTILDNILSVSKNIQIYHLSNGVDTDKFHPIIKSDNFPSIKIVYAGLHGLAQGLQQVIIAAKILMPDSRYNFIFIGDGPDKKNLIQFAQSIGTTNVQFLNPVAKIKIPDILADSDILIVPLKIQLTGAVPSKMYEAMAMGKPIILIAESEAAEIVKNAECGIIVRPGETQGIVDAIKFLADNPNERIRMGVNGREVVKQKYERKKIIDLFAEFLKNKI